MNNNELISGNDDNQKEDIEKGEQTKMPISKVVSKDAASKKNVIPTDDVEKTPNTPSNHDGKHSQERHVTQHLKSVKDENSIGRIDTIKDNGTKVQSDSIPANQTNKKQNQPNGEERFNCDLTTAAKLIENFVANIKGICKTIFCDKSQSIVNCPYLLVYFKPGIMYCSLYLNADEDYQVKQVAITYRMGDRKVVTNMNELKKALNSSRKE